MQLDYPGSLFGNERPGSTQYGRPTHGGPLGLYDDYPPRRTPTSTPVDCQDEQWPCRYRLNLINCTALQYLAWLALQHPVQYVFHGQLDMTSIVLSLVASEKREKPYLGLPGP